MTSSRPNSLVLSDWGAYSAVYKSPKKLVNDLILLSLLYDEILIQDEVLVLSDSLPKWFSGLRNASLLNKIFELDSVVVLAWPVSGYTNNILTDPTKHPIFARAEWHEKNSTRNDQIFTPTDSHYDFYKRLEAALLTRKTSIRERGKDKDINVGQTFRDILTSILSHNLYKSWLNSQYPILSTRISDNILSYIDNPILAVQDMKTKGYEANVVLQNDMPVFNRSLGFQVSRMYQKSEREALQQLIQSVYAIPLCESEKAVGKYSGLLKEVPWFPLEEQVLSFLHEEPVRVEAAVETQLTLPDHIEDFPAVINHIRKTKEGKALRKAVRQIGGDHTFSNVSNCWSEVAGLLNQHVKRKNTTTARTTAISFGAKTLIGTVIGTALNLPLNPAFAEAINSGIGEGAGVIFDHGYQLLKNYMGNTSIRKQIENSVEFRCTWIPSRKKRNESGK